MKNIKLLKLNNLDIYKIVLIFMIGKEVFLLKELNNMILRNILTILMEMSMLQMMINNKNRDRIR